MDEITINELISWLEFIENHKPKFNYQIAGALELIGVFCKDAKLLEKIVPLIKEKKFEEIVSFIFNDSSLIYSEFQR